VPMESVVTVDARRGSEALPASRSAGRSHVVSLPPVFTAAGSTLRHRGMGAPRRRIYGEKGESCSSSTTSRSQAVDTARDQRRVSKYFRGAGTPQRETSVRQLIGGSSERYARGVSIKGICDPRRRGSFGDELTHLLLHQKGCFNSPVWFNVGSMRALSAAHASFFGRGYHGLHPRLVPTRGRDLQGRLGVGRQSLPSASSRERLAAEGRPLVRSPS